jgi:glycine oxidase
VNVTTCEARAVTAGGDRIEADIVVLAVGAWSASLSPALSALTPTKGQILEVESYALRPGETVRAPDVYLVSRAAGRLIIGATMEFGARDLETDRATIEALHARAARWLPDVADAPILRAWAGVRPMSADSAPRIGWRDGVLVACGHSRNGWLLAPITAEIVAAYVHGEAIPDLWKSFAP